MLILEQFYGGSSHFLAVNEGFLFLCASFLRLEDSLTKQFSLSTKTRMEIKKKPILFDDKLITPTNSDIGTINNINTSKQMI